MKRLLLLASLIVVACQTPSKEEKSKSLFNGIDLTGWHVDVPDLEKDSTQRNPFIVRNGMLVSLGTPEGHLITDAVSKTMNSTLNIVLPVSREIVVCWYMRLRLVLCMKCFLNLWRFN